MSESTVQISRDVTSVNGSASVSDAVRVAGQYTTFQSYAPSADVTIQISNDGVNWVTGTNVENSLTPPCTSRTPPRPSLAPVGRQEIAEA